MHDLPCQLTYSKAYIEGNGLAFGEEIEQLWAKLRYLWPRVKYMLSENRYTIISSSLASITADMISNLTQTLSSQYKRAKQVLSLAEDALAKFRAQSRELDDASLKRIYDMRFTLFADSASLKSGVDIFGRDVQLVTIVNKKIFYDSQ